ASRFRIKSGVARDGRIWARECEVWWNGGAYADIGPRVTQKSGFTAAGPYDIEHVAIDSYPRYTNLPPAGALRGFGIPQLMWAYECHTDMMARELGIDPIEFRRRNLLRDGRPQATGTLMRDAAIEKAPDRLAVLLEGNRPFDRGAGGPRRGAGRLRRRPDARRAAVLGGRRQRRGDRGGHRDGPGAGGAAGQRRRRRHADQPEDRRDTALRRGDHAARLHAVRENAVRRARPAAQCVARGVQDPRLPGRARRDHQ